MKKILTTFIIACCTFLMGSQAFAYDAQVSSVSARPGEAVTIAATFSANTGDILGVQTLLEYDPNVLRLDSWRKGTLFANGLADANTDVPGAIEVGIIPSDPVVGASGELFTVSFTVLATAPAGLSNIRMTRMILTRNGPDELAANITHGSVTVIGLSNPPVLDAIGNKNINEGQLLSFVINATDPDAGSVLTYSATNLPGGANFDPATRIFSWTPTASNVGDHSVTFTVADNATPALTDSETITISVASVVQPQAAQITQPANGAMINPLTATLSWASAPGVGVLAYFVDFSDQPITIRGSGQSNALLPTGVTSAAVPDSFLTKQTLYATLWTQVGPLSTDWFRFDTQYTIQIEENQNITPPAFSMPEGFYPAAISVELTSTDPQAVIVYTLDGSEPIFGAQSDTTEIYSGAISVAATTTIRARAVTDQGFSPIATQTFFINVNTNGLAVISLVSDPANLFDAQDGIYVEGPDPLDPNYLKDISKPVEFSFFESSVPASNSVLNGRGTLKIQGEAGTRAYPQKSLEIISGQQIQYPLFGPGQGVLPLTSFILSNAGHDWASTLLRNRLVTSMADDLAGIESVADRSVVVFINGQYYGIHQLRQGTDVSYFQQFPNPDPSSLSLLQISDSGPEALLGTASDYTQLVDFVNTHDLSQDQNYNIVAGEIDINSFLDFMVLQIYSGNVDCQDQNSLVWRLNNNSLWRWIVTETHGFNLFPDMAPIDQDTLSFSIDHSLLLKKLLDNAGFRQAFINKAADFINFGIVDAASLNTELTALQSQITNEMPNHIAQWQSMTLPEWNDNILALRQFLNGRQPFFVQHMMNYFSLTSTSSIRLHNALPAGGVVEVNGSNIAENFGDIDLQYFTGNSVVLRALPATGHQFVGWLINGQPNTQQTIEVLPQDGMVIEVQFEAAGTNHPPVLAVIADQTMREDEVRDVVLTASDPDSDPLTVAVTVEPSSFTHFSFTNDNIHITPVFSDAGTYTVTVVVSDGRGGSATRNFQLTIQDVPQNRAPVITALADRTLAENQTLEVPVSVSDADGDPITLNVSSNPASFTRFNLQGQTIHFTPDFTDAGVYTITISASDGRGGSDTESFVVTVTDVNRPPFVSSISNKSVSEGQTLDVAVSATDPDGQAVTLNVSSNPSSFTRFSLQSQTIRFTPNFSDAGTYTMTVAASDGQGGSHSITFMLMVVDVPQGVMFIRGDANNDNRVNMADVLFVRNYLLHRGSAPAVRDAADANDDGRIDIRDMQRLILTVFCPRIAPLPAPYPSRGLDPTPDNL